MQSKKERKQNVFLDDIKKDMHWRINVFLRVIGNESIDKSDTSLFWDERGKLLEFCVVVSKEALEKMNNNKNLINNLKVNFKKHFQYEGECNFSDHIFF